MRCDCALGAQHCDEIVQWHRSLGQIFNTLPCPAEWFKPNIKESYSEGMVTREIEKAVQIWAGRLQVAKDFWNNEKRKLESP